MKKTTENEEINETQGIKLTTESIKALEALVYNFRKIKLDQEAFNEDVKAIASKINGKPGDVKEMVNSIIQEQDKGGVIEKKEQKLDLIKQVLSYLDKTLPETEQNEK